MFMNDWIALISDTFLFLGVCVALNLKEFSFSTYNNAINSFLAVIFGLILLAFPFFVGIFYRRFTKLSVKEVIEFVSRYGNGIEGLNFKR